MKKIITIIAAITLAFGISNETLGQTIISQTSSFQVAHCGSDSTTISWVQYHFDNCQDSIRVLFYGNNIDLANAQWTYNGASYSAINDYSGIGWREHYFSTTTVGVYSFYLSTPNGCADSVSFTVFSCIPTSTSSQSICQGDSVFFDNRWITQSGTYQDSLVNNGVVDSIRILYLSVNSAPQLYIYGDSCVSGNDSLYLYAYSGTSSQYVWTLNGNVIGSSSYISPTDTGTYTAIAYGQCGNDTATITVYRCIPTSASSQSICQGDSVFFDNRWITQSGTYQDSLVNNGVVDSIRILYLSVNSAPQLYIYGDSCVSGNDSLYLYAYSGTSSQYVWTLNGNVIGSSSYISPTDTGAYTVIAYGQCGNDTATITVYRCIPTSASSQSICQGDSVFFDNRWITQSGTYQDSLVNNGVVDSIRILYLSVNSAPQLYIYGDSCVSGNDSLYLYAYSGTSSQYVWTLNGNVIGSSSYISPTAIGTYTVIAYGQCGDDTATVTVQPCLSDSVWPGDADHNGVCDNYDLLPIGIANGIAGVARASTSIVWQGWACADWGSQLLNGTNAKYVDCTGDGIIDPNDTTAVIQNFGLAHNKTEEQRKPDRAGISGLYIVFEKDTLVAGDTLVASVRLGTPENPVSDAYGLAFTYNFDQSVIDTSSVSFTYTNSWLGGSADKLSLAKKINDIGKIKTAVTRFDHVNRSGSGEIAQFRGIITTDNINGKDLSYYTTSHFISGLKAIDKDENVIELNEGIDSAKVGYEEKTGIRELTSSSWSLYPNPANNNITIKNTENIEGIAIWNVLGEKVYELNNVNQELQTISIGNLANGIYVARIQTTHGSGEKRFIVAK